MTVRLTVHRATNQIGGNCIEIASGDHRIVLDVGRPLDAPNDAVGLMPTTLNLTRPVDGVLISHPHQDHYGLLGECPSEWPVYSGDATRRLIQITNGIFGEPLEKDFRTWRSGHLGQIGPFKVTPFLTDHSAFDAHMLLIEVEGKRVLYSGDFRRHGRKSKLVDALMASPPESVDVLLLEGTNLGSDKPTKSEAALEQDFVDLFRSTAGRVFIAWSAQNVDRTVTVYRAALQVGRTLVVDLYTAEVLEALADFGRLPQPDWASIKVVITSSLARMYRRKGRGDFVDRMAKTGTSARALERTPAKWAVMIRPSLLRDFQANGVKPTPSDAWSYSMWQGYLKDGDGLALKSAFDTAGATAAHLHTSGHASTADLKAFAKSIDPRWMVPIHGLAWDNGVVGFPPIRRLTDGEPMVL